MRIRREDLAGRYGNDEFLIIMPDISMEEMKRRTEDLRRSIKKELNLVYKKAPVFIKVFSGLAMFPEHGKQCGELIEATNQALREAEAAEKLEPPGIL